MVSYLVRPVNFRALSATLLLIVAASCGPPEPDAERIKGDLIGRRVTAGQSVWGFDSLREFESVEVLATERSDRVLEHKIRLDLIKDDEPFRAKGSVTYAKDGGEWQLRAVNLTELYSVNERAQRQTVKMIRNLGTAYLSYLVDHGQSGVVSRRAEPLSAGELESRLHPSDEFFYIMEVPKEDGWGHRLEVWVRPVEFPEYDVLIRSPGSDGEFEDGQLYGEGGFLPSDHWNDIVWADGDFRDRPAFYRRE